MIQFLQQLRDRCLPQQTRPTLTVDDEGFALAVDGTLLCRFGWELVTRVEAYKRDLITTDLICLDIYLDSVDGQFTLHEEMEGFDAIADHLHDYIAAVPNDWFGAVMFPPFAANHRVLYDRVTR